MLLKGNNTHQYRGAQCSEEACDYLIDFSILLVRNKKVNTSEKCASSNSRLLSSTLFISSPPSSCPVVPMHRYVSL